MYTNLLQEDSVILDMEFFKLNNMFENVNKIYAIQQKELEYSYIYTENNNEKYINLYTEAESAKNNKHQSLLGKMFTAILNFIRNVRAKILRIFGNDKKADELEAEIKNNPNLANKTIEITDYTDAMKAVNEGTSFFGSLIDKIIGGSATQKDADDAENMEKSILGRIGKIALGVAAGFGAGSAVNDKLKKRKIKVSQLSNEQSIIETQVKDITQRNEEKLEKGQKAMMTYSNNTNDENSKAANRILNSFKSVVGKIGNFFTTRTSEIKSKASEIKSNVDNKTDEVKTKVTDKASEIKSNVNNKTDEIKTKVSDKVSEIKSDAMIDKCTQYAIRLLKHKNIKYSGLKEEIQKMVDIDYYNG